MKTLLTVLIYFVTLAAFGQPTPSPTMRSTNGTAWGATLRGNTRIGVGTIATNPTVIGTLTAPIVASSTQYVDRIFGTNSSTLELLAADGSLLLLGSSSLNLSGAPGGFVGPGQSITALNASQLTSGTLPAARFPAILPAVDGSQLTGITGGSVLLTNSLGTNLIYPQWKIAIWGDSLTAYGTELNRVSGREVFQSGNSGYRTDQIRIINTNATYNYLKPWGRVIWAGVNDILGISEGGTNSLQNMTNNIYQMVTNGDSRFLVLGTFNVTNWPAGNTNYWLVTNFNAQLAAAYTNHFFDMREFITGRGTPSLTNGSLADFIDYTNNVPLNSLRTDNIHPNATARGLIAMKVMERLLMIETNTLDQAVTRGELLAVTRNHPSIGPSLTIVNPAPSTVSTNPSIIVVSSNSTTIFEARFTGGGALDNAANTFLGLNSGMSLTPAGVNSGDANTSVGSEALKVLTVGRENVAIGNRALFSLVTGGENVAVGTFSLYSATGNNNTAVGYNSATATTTGIDNVAVGYAALQSNAGGQGNTAVGKYAMRNNVSGTFNTAVGLQSLNSNTSDDNVGVGVNAFANNTSGTLNTGVGRDAGRVNIAGKYNTFLGAYTGYGDGSSGVASTNDDFNVFIGYQAGRDSSIFGVKLTNTIAIGKGAKVMASNQAVIGGTNTDAVTLVVHGGYRGNVGQATNSAGVAIDDFPGVGGGLTNADTRPWTNSGGFIGVNGTTTNELRVGQSTAFSSGWLSLKYTAPKFGLLRSSTDDHFVYYDTATGDTVLNDTFGAAVKLNRQGVNRLKVDATAVTISYPLIVTNTVTATNGFYTPSGGYTNKTVAWLAGTGSPEGAVVAAIGSMWSRTDGSTDTALYRKETGTGNTGWVAVSAGAAGGGTTNVVNDGTRVALTGTDGLGGVRVEADGTEILGVNPDDWDYKGYSDRLVIRAPDDGASITLSNGNTITMLGTVSGITEASIETFNATNVNFYGPANIRTNIAQFDVDATAFVVGTRYTNSTRRSFVTASFTLNGAAAGTAAVTLSAEQAGVTNMVKIAAGPLASLTTIEQLSLMVGPGAFYYFTDATTGTGASVAIVTGTSSRTDL